MNNGNYEHNMVMTTRVHTTPKRVLHWNDEELEDEKNCSVKDYKLFLKFVNDFESISMAVCSMTDGKWKFLYAILRNFADALEINYCVYENPTGMLFDITSHSIEYKEAAVVRERETEAEQMQRLKLELAQIDMKIDHLRNKRKELSERLMRLVQMFVGDSYEVVVKGDSSECRLATSA